MSLSSFFNIWIIFTLALFYFGPIPWEGAHRYAVGAYVLFCLLFFNIGTRLKVAQHVTGSVARLTPQRVSIVYAIILLFVVLSAIHINLVTGKNAFLPSSYSLDFGRAYQDFGEQLGYKTSSSITFLVTLVKAIVFPFVVLIFIDRLGRDWLAIAAIAFPMIASSALRGTDKEIFDLLLIGIIGSYYKGLLRWRVAFAPFIVAGFFSLFLARRISRFDGRLPSCLPDSAACFDYYSPVAKILGVNAEILWVFLTNYLTQGYEALDKAFDMTFHFNFLVGHLPPIKAASCSFGIFLCDVESYQSQLTATGWDTSTRWTSVYPVLANDLSFYLVPLYFLIMGFLFRKFEGDWASRRDFAALAGLIMISNFMIFSSANMQVAISLDWVAALLLFAYMPLARYAWAR